MLVLPVYIYIMTALVMSYMQIQRYFCGEDS